MHSLCWFPFIWIFVALSNEFLFRLQIIWLKLYAIYISSNRNWAVDIENMAPCTMHNAHVKSRIYSRKTRARTINKSIQWHFLSIETITHTHTVQFQGIFKLSPIQKHWFCWLNRHWIQIIGWRQNIATQRESMSSCFILFFLNPLPPPPSSPSFNFISLFFHSIYNCALSAYCFRSKHFLWINSYWSLIIIRFCSKFSETLDWNDFSFRSFIIVIRKRGFMSDSKVNLCRTAWHYITSLNDIVHVYIVY